MQNVHNFSGDFKKFQILNVEAEYQCFADFIQIFLKLLFPEITGGSLTPVPPSRGG